MSNQVKNWTANQLKAIYWLATPERLREPQTQREFSAKLGVREETFSRWKNDSGLMAEVNSVARAELGKDLPEVYGTLRKMAIKGSFQHMKLYLELLEEYSEEVNVNVNDQRERERERVRRELSEFERRRRAQVAG